MSVEPDQDWKLVLLPQEAVYLCDSLYLDRAYRAWKEVWGPVYQTVGLGDPLHSDTFTRQWDRLALFYRGECAALTLFNRTDLARPHHADDSYFGCWPELARRGLIRKGTRVLVCSAFTITPKFRKGTFDFDMKDLLTGLSIRYFLDAPFDAMTGNMRNSKGMNEVMYRWGATPLMKNVAVHGEPSDLVGFFKANVRIDAVPEITELMNRLWADRIVEGLPEKASIRALSAIRRVA